MVQIGEDTAGSGAALRCVFNHSGNQQREMKCYTSIPYIFLCNAFLMVVFKSRSGGGEMIGDVVSLSLFFFLFACIPA